MHNNGYIPVTAFANYEKAKEEWSEIYEAIRELWKQNPNNVVFSTHDEIVLEVELPKFDMKIPLTVESCKDWAWNTIEKKNELPEN